MMKKINKDVKTVSSMWFSQVFCAGLAFFTQMIIASKVDVVDFGSFSTAFSLVGIFSSVAGFGIGSFWLKVFSTEGWQGMQWLKSTRLISTASIIVSVIGMLLVFRFSNFNANTNRLILLFCIVIISQGLLNNALSVFQLDQNYNGYILAYSLPHIGRFCMSLLIAFFFNEIVMFGVGYALVGVIVIIIAVKELNKLYAKNITLMGNPNKEIFIEKHKGFNETFINVLPFALSSILYLLYYQIDITLISYIKGEAASGPYYLAFTIISVVYLLPNAIYQGFLLPKIHYWSKHNVGKLKKLYHKGNILMFLVGMVIMLIFMFIVPYFITLFLNQNFHRAIPFVKILSLCIPIRFISANSGGIMTTGKLINSKIRIQLVGAIVNIFLNLILIVRYGAEGAAYSTIVTELVIMILLHYKTIRYFKESENK